MPQKTGTYDINSLLAANNQTVVEYGEDNIAQVLAADNAAFSAQVTEALADIAVTTEERQLLAGSSLGGNMMEVDEYATAPTQKDLPGYFVGFPLRKFTFAVGFTKAWLRNAKAADLAIRNQAAQGADLRRARYELQKAIFNPTNYTFIDLNVDNAPLPVKALINADSTGIQNGPNGEVFDGTSHTHYDGVASLTATALQATINDVAEHRVGVKMRVFISALDVTTVSALTGFYPLQAPYLTINANANQVANPRLEIDQLDNRQIGWFGAAEVWTKPWIPQNYLVAVDTAAPIKPLARRVEIADRGLFLAADVSLHPLEAQYTEHFYGFGAYNRLAMAVLKFNNATYSAPALTY